MANQYKTQYEFFQKKYQELDEERQKLQGRLEGANRVKRECERRIEELEEDVKVFEEKAKNHEEKVEVLEKEVRRLKRDKENLNDRLTEGENKAQEDRRRQGSEIDVLNMRLTASLAEYAELRKFIIETFGLDETTTTITTELLANLGENGNGASKEEIKRLNAIILQLKIDLSAAQNKPAPDNQGTIEKLTKEKFELIQKYEEERRRYEALSTEVRIYHRESENSSEEWTKVAENADKNLQGLQELLREMHQRFGDALISTSAVNTQMTGFKSHKCQRFSISETIFTKNTHSSSSSYSGMSQSSGSSHEQSEEY